MSLATKPGVKSISNLYGRLLLFVLLMLITVILTSESAGFFENDERGQKFGGLIYSFFCAGFVFSSIPVLSQLGYSKKVRKIVSILGCISVVGMLVVSNPFLDLLPNDLKPGMFSLFHLVLMIAEILFARVLLIDIFGNTETQTDHIWGAIVVYYLLIMIFAEVYEILCIIQPGMLGQVYFMGFPNYIHIIMFSINAITGMDAIYPQAHPLFFKLGNLENLIGNLFLVVILGRLLSHPIKKLKQPNEDLT